MNIRRLFVDYMYVYVENIVFVLPSCAICFTSIKGKIILKTKTAHLF